MNTIGILLDFTLTQFKQIAGYWIIGLVIGSIISVFCKEHISNIAEKMNHEKWGVFGMIPAALLGIASPLCMYGTIPVAAALARKKVPQDWLTSFVVCSILLNPQLLIYTLALSVPITLMRFIVCFLAGIIAGLLVRFCFRNSSFYKFIDFETLVSHDTDPNHLFRLLKNLGRAFRITAPYFLIGIVLTAIYQTFFPVDMAKRIFSWNPGFGVLFAAALGVPLYACGGGNIPLLGAWLEAGMSSGSAAAFMITGQAIKITNLSAVKIILGPKHFAFYIMYAILFSIITGLVIDIFI
jgi:uncharacterized membrane protein YraQ (UPF0718 family)